MLSWEARGSALPPPCVTGRFSCEAASPRAMLCAQAHHGASSPVPPPPKKQLGCSTGALCASPGVGNCHGESKVVALWDPTNPGAVTPTWAQSSPSCAYLCSSVRLSSHKMLGLLHWLRLVSRAGAALCLVVHETKVWRRL